MNAHKVIWQEGMLLRPQHFQHNDRYYDHQMKTRTQLLGGYTWGFLNLEIDLQFLNMGKLVISAASGILPDGSLFELGGNTARHQMLKKAIRRSSGTQLFFVLYRDDARSPGLTHERHGISQRPRRRPAEVPGKRDARQRWSLFHPSRAG